MEKGGELKTRLSERLAQRQAEELAEVATLTEANLTQLSERLTQHVENELSTTSNAISLQSAQINALLRSQQSALGQQQETVDALKRLSLADLELIRDGLSTALTKAHGEAITEAIEPLRTALDQLKTDGEALSRLTFRGWLKPLLISLAVLLALWGSTWGVTSALAAYASHQWNTFQTRLPSGAVIMSSEGKQYILAEKIGKPFKVEQGEYKGQMAVEIE